AGRQPIVVAIANFGGRNGVVLIDHRHSTPFEQLRDRGAGVEISAALFGVAERYQDLSGADLVAAERLGPGAREHDLAHGRRRLAVLELERPGWQLQDGAAERDRAR